MGRAHPWQAEIAPPAEPSGQGRDPGVPEVEERPRCEHRSDSACAVHDDLAVLPDQSLDAELEVPPRQKQGTGEMALGRLVRLADVEQHGGTLGPEACSEGLGCDLADDGTGLLEKLTERGHRVPTAYNRPGRGGQEARGR